MATIVSNSLMRSSQVQPLTTASINDPGEGGTTYGSIVTGLQNEVTGKAVDLMVHPWLNQGVAPVLSWTLPIPDTQVSDVWANFLVQDYMGIQWPVTQFTYDFSPIS